MDNEKITITNRLRLDMIERRKEKGMSCYDLSEQVGNGHSKFWLPNIESGKTKKITKNDLISIYMVLDDGADEASATYMIESILKQSIGDNPKEWYELIEISEDYENVFDEDELMDELDGLLENFQREIRNAVFSMNISQRQAALTAFQNFYRSLYKDPDLAFALINIPVYGVSKENKEEYNNSLNDLFAISAKYNDLVLKNHSMETIRTWEELDRRYAIIDRQYIQKAFENYKDMLQEFLDISKAPKKPSEIELRKLVTKFVKTVVVNIEEGQPNARKNYLKSGYSIYTGEKFAQNILECYDWFAGFSENYDVDIDSVSFDLVKSVMEYFLTVDRLGPYIIDRPI